jgi:hypothetical protein
MQRECVNASGFKLKCSTYLPYSFPNDREPLPAELYIITSTAKNTHVQVYPIGCCSAQLKWALLSDARVGRLIKLLFTACSALDNIPKRVSIIITRLVQQFMHKILNCLSLHTLRPKWHSMMCNTALRDNFACILAIGAIFRFCMLSDPKVKLQQCLVLRSP